MSTPSDLPPPRRVGDRPQSTNGVNTNAPTPTLDIPTSADLPQSTMAQSRGSISSFLFLTFMLFMLTSGGDDIVVRNQYRETLKELLWERGNFTVWLSGNQTGGNFTMPEFNPVESSLARSIIPFGTPLDPATSSYYEDISGYIDGPIHFANLTFYHNDSTVASTDGSSVDSSSTLKEDPGDPSSPVEPSSLSSPDTPLPWHPFAIELMQDLNLTNALERLNNWNASAYDKMAIRVLESRPMELPLSTIMESGSSTSPDEITSEASESIENSVKTGLSKEEEKNDADIVNLNLNDTSLVQGRFTLSSSNTDDEVVFDLEAIHYVLNGTLYGVVGPPGNTDIRELPSIVPPEYANRTAQIIDMELSSRIKRLEEILNDGSVDVGVATNGNTQQTTCSFHLYAQVHASHVPLTQMKEYESELEHPTGVRIAQVGDLKLSGVLLSRKCGVMLEFKDVEGLKSQRYWRKVTTYAGFAAVLYVILLVLLSRQTLSSRTPAGISKLSRWTFISQGATDAVAFIGHVTFGVLSQGRPSMSLFAPAFLSCILVVYEAQFSFLIQQIQLPEQTAPPPTVPGTGQPEGSYDNTGLEFGSTFGTSRSFSSRFSRLFAPFMRLQRILFTPYVRTFFTVFLTISILVRILMTQFVSLITIGVLYSGMWLPQIVRSVRRGSGSGLSAGYLLGTTACRSFFALYIFGCPHNILSMEVNSWICILIASMFVQALVVILQEHLNPAFFLFFLPKHYLKIEKYDYHPLIPPVDPEAPEQSLGDCSICMDAIKAPTDTYSTHTFHNLYSKSASRSRSNSISVATAMGKKNRRDSNDMENGAYASGRPGVGGGRSLLDKVQMGFGTTGAKKPWAVAPCHHIFHTSCLERWLAIKNICPQCRRPLPPL